MDHQARLELEAILKRIDQHRQRLREDGERAEAAIREAQARQGKVAAPTE
jgi:hypothetical protein